MIKYSFIIAVFAFACAQQKIQVTPTVLTPPAKGIVTVTPIPESILADPISEVQSICLTEGTSSLTEVEKWLQLKHPEVCNDKNTMNSLHIEASAAGDRDAFKIIVANLLQCLSEVNELPSEIASSLQGVSEEIISTLEMRYLKRRLIKSSSCLSQQIQETIVYTGFNCGFLTSLSSTDTMKHALEIYVDTASTLSLINEDNEDSLKASIAEGSMCYRSILNSIKNRIEGSADEISSIPSGNGSDLSVQVASQQDG